MDPGTLAIGSMAAGAAGSLIQGIGQGYSGAATASAYTYKAGVAQLNKQINLTNANWAIESGDISAEESGLRSGQERGQTLVTQAASGLDVTTGSAKAVRDTQDSVAQFDQDITRWNAAKAGWGYEAKAATDDAETQLDLMAAKGAKTGGTLAEIGTFLGGAGSVASKWYQGTNVGIFGGSKSGIGLFDPTNYGAAPTWTG